MQGERGDLYNKLKENIRRIIPNVCNISTRPTNIFTPNAEVEILVWPKVDMPGPEFGFGLFDSGAGVAQVIAILTAVMTCENAVIIIDEINTFLHPAAVKALLRILQSDYAHHQYIIASHSPEVISFGNPQSVHLVRRDGYESSVQKLDLKNIKDLREAAAQLGISMMDVFAAEKIVWVEGETEELCFPLLYELATGKPLSSAVKFISVLATGDFQRKRNRKLVSEIYRRLSTAAMPLATPAVISFDSEALSDDEKRQMSQESKGAIKFLPRRNFECYLIDPTAIAEFISQRLPGEIPPKAEDVKATLCRLAGDEKFNNSYWAGNLFCDSWLKRVDGARIIEETCANLSDNSVRYRKNADACEIIKKIAHNNRAHLQELCDYVRSLVDAVSCPPSPG